MPKFGVLAEQDQASKPFYRSLQGKNRRAERKQNRSLPQAKDSTFGPPQNRWIRLDLGRRLRRSPPHRSNARFLEWFPLTSSGFLESGVTLVECPDCKALRTLKPHGGVLRFKSHDRRKTTTPNTGQRWARGKPDRDVVGGE